MHLSIGEFSQRTRLSVKALRIYERNGLLVSDSVDPSNGYRRYSPAQVRRGQLIALLRGADLSLAAISAVIDLPPGLAASALDGHLRGLDERKQLIRFIQASIRGESSMFTTVLRAVPELRVMTMQQRLTASSTDAFALSARAAFAELLGAWSPTGPFMLIFHGQVNETDDGPLEAIMGCPDLVQPTSSVGVRTEPAHDEAYTTITKAQWAYPAILAAYDAVACSPLVLDRPGSRLSCREVYLADPDVIGDDDLVCDIAFPLG